MGEMGEGEGEGQPLSIKDMEVTETGLTIQEKPLEKKPVAQEQPKKSLGEQYLDEVKEGHRKRETDIFKAKTLTEMEETGEILGRDHPMHGQVEEILKTLAPLAKYELYLSLSDELKAFTLPDNGVVVIASGLIKKFETFLQGKDKHVTKGGLALILAHELSHWDPEAKTFHLNETYCDTNGLMMEARKYNTDDAVSALEFLEWIEDEEEKERPKKEEQGLRIPITHPSSENRRVLALSIVNNPEIHLDGRYIDSEEIPQNITADFIKRGEEWLKASQKRNQIASESEITAEFGKAKTLSQVIETFLSADDFYHARLVKEFGQSPEFERIVLALAVFHEAVYEKGKGMVSFPPISNDDLYTHYRAGLIAEKSDLPARQITLPETVFTPDKSRPIAKLNDSTIDLINRCLKGEFADPLAILTLDQETLAKKYPEFAGFNFNKTFSQIIEDINDSIAPHRPWDVNREKRIFDPKKAKLLGFEGILENNLYISGENGEVTPEIAEKRRQLMEKIKYGLAGAFFSFAQEGRSWMDDFRKQVLLPASSVYQPHVPDYDKFYEFIVQRLGSGHCQTKEAGQYLADAIVDCGRYALPERAIRGKRTEINHSFNEQADDRIRQDIRQAIFGFHAGITAGGSEINGFFDSTRLRLFIRGINSYFYQLRERQDQFLQDQFLNPFDIAGVGDATIETPGQNYMEERIDFLKKLFTNYDRYADEKMICHTTDLTIINKLFAKVAGYERKITLLNAVLANKDIIKDPNTIDLLIKTGIENKALYPEEIKRILEKKGETQLWRKYLPYLATVNISDFYDDWFKEFKEQPDNANLRKGDLITRFVEEGGVIDLWGKGERGRLARQGASKVDLELSDLGGNHGGEENPELTFDEARQTGQMILDFVNSPQCSHPDKAKEELIDTTAVLLAYAEGLDYNAYHAQHFSDLGKDIDSFPPLLERLKKIPRSSKRDTYIDAAKYLFRQRDRAYPQDFIDLTQLLELFKLYSAGRLREYDFGEKEANMMVSSHMIKSLALTQDSIDMAERFSFWHDPNDGIYETVQQMNFQLSAQESLSMAERLNTAIEAFPCACGFRDYLMESALLPLIKDEGQLSSLGLKERAALFEKAFENSRTQRTRQSLASELVRLRLEALGSQITFEAGLAEILKIMPEGTSARDNFITNLMNSTYMTWEQIDQAQALILGHNYRTDTRESAIHSGMMEAMAFGIEQLEVEERTELITFFLNAGKHVLKKEQLTPEFFDDFVKVRLKKKLVGKHYSEYTSWGDPVGEKNLEITAQEFDTNYEGIKQKLLRRYMSEEERKKTEIPEIPVKFEKVLDYKRFKLADLLGLGTPERLNNFLKNQLSTGKEELSATSLGTLFLAANPSDRRQIIYRLCLGDHGFFEEGKFTDNGAKVIEALIDIATTVRKPDLGSGELRSTWADKEKTAMKQAVLAVFSSLSPGRRTEILARTINLLADSGGQVSKEQLIEIGLTAFDVVGAKIGQMDVLMPENLRQSLASLKEEVPPLPKSTIALRLKKEARDHYYQGLGRAKGGSTASIVFSRSIGSDADDCVIKMIRPDVLKNVDENIKAAMAGITALSQSHVLSVDPSQIIEELTTMIKEELDPSYERAHTKMLAVLRRRRGKERIGTPTIIHTGKGHIEMTAVDGRSLGDIRDIKARAQRGELLKDDEEKYLQVPDKKVYEDVVADFFYQAFKLGIFHTDLHEGNIFSNPYGGVTEIDHGQAGLEDSVERRTALVQYTLGIALHQPKLIAKALKAFSPDIQPGETETFLNSQQDMLRGLTKFLSEKHIRGSINRFTKALINVFPYIQQLDRATLQKIMLPYIASKAVVFDVIKTIPSLLAEKTLKVIGR